MPKDRAKEEKEEELEEAHALLKEGFDKIWKATKKVSREIVEGFKEGYNKKDTPDK